MVGASPVSHPQSPVAWRQAEEWEEAPLAQRERCRRMEPEEGGLPLVLGR